MQILQKWIILYSNLKISSLESVSSDCMKNTKATKKTIETQNDLNILIENIFSSINTIHKLRFIQKICRPLSIQERDQIFKIFRESLSKLHTDMEMLKKQSHRFKINHGYEKIYQNKKKINSITFKHYVVRISGKYNEVFINSSFKHYNKVASIYKLPEIKIIDSEKWVETTLENKAKVKCC